MSLKEKALKLHKKIRGKISIQPTIKITKNNLPLLYTPGVAEASIEIFRNKEKVYEYTRKWNSVAIVTDGSRVLGLGNVGPEAALPVMEGKALLYKALGGVDAYPICLKTQEVEEIIEIVEKISPSFGGINLEDIDSPKCFEIERALQKKLDIPVFHDDQYGTGIVVLAALINALKVVGKELQSARIAIAGAGAGGTGVVKVLHAAGARNLLVVDSKGIIYRGREELNVYKKELAEITNPENLTGSLKDASKAADAFIGLSGVKNLLQGKMIKLMAENPIIFALSNPYPEILPAVAKKFGAKVVATGCSDFPNQVNNSLVFPGLFRGLLDARASAFTLDMCISAAYAIAKLVKPRADKILPSMHDKRVVKSVANAVAKIAVNK
jgi:malate dehydrogenase (oxaloacetate-decarboxylating)